MNKRFLTRTITDLNDDNLEDGQALDELLELLKKGSAKDVNLASYIINDTVTGEDYLTDVECIDLIIEKYDLKKRT